MTPNQQFWIQLITLVLAGVVTPMIAMFSVYLSKKSEGKVEELDAKVVESHKQINSRMDEYMKALEQKYLLMGQNQGRAAEKADQALREGAPVFVPPTPNQQASIPTATNPLLTENKLAEILADQPPPTVIAVNTEGEALLSEKTAVQLLGTPPSEPDELVRKRWEEES